MTCIIKWCLHNNRGRTGRIQVRIGYFRPFRIQYNSLRILIIRISQHIALPNWIYKLIHRFIFSLFHQVYLFVFLGSFKMSIGLVGKKFFLRCYHCWWWVGSRSGKSGHGSRDPDPYKILGIRNTGQKLDNDVNQPAFGSGQVLGRPQALLNQFSILPAQDGTATPLNRISLWLCWNLEYRDSIMYLFNTKNAKVLY
jgi:hypothetical protein